MSSFSWGRTVDLLLVCRIYCISYILVLAMSRCVSCKGFLWGDRVGGKLGVNCLKPAPRGEVKAKEVLCIRNNSSILLDGELNCVPFCL